MRVRLVGATLALDIVTDDGRTLEPVAMNAIRLTPAELMKLNVADVLAKVAAELGLGTKESSDA